MRPLEAGQLQRMPARVAAFHPLRLRFAVLLLVSSFLGACAKPEQSSEPAPAQPISQTVEGTPLSQVAETASAQKISPAPPPKLNEVQEAVTRVFKDAAIIDAGQNPNFIVGDFNGDQSTDIAIILKPAPGALSQMNEELPPWILKDPFATNQRGMPPLRVTESDTLLAIVHGYGANGWRDTQATQTFLLKNAVGSGVTPHAKETFIAANKNKKLPRLRGDLIGETLRGRSGYLYYADSTYGWYDPKTFKPQPEKPLVHPGIIRKEQ